MDTDKVRAIYVETEIDEIDRQVVCLSIADFWAALEESVGDNIQEFYVPDLDGAIMLAVRVTSKMITQEEVNNLPIRGGFLTSQQPT